MTLISYTTNVMYIAASYNLPSTSIDTEKKCLSVLNHTPKWKGGNLGYFVNQGHSKMVKGTYIPAARWDSAQALYGLQGVSSCTPEGEASMAGCRYTTLVMGCPAAAQHSAATDVS